MEATEPSENLTTKRGGKLLVTTLRLSSRYSARIGDIAAVTAQDAPSLRNADAVNGPTI
jgi:hypothetical protein